MACCRPSTIAKAHRGSSAYMISSAQTCAPKQSVAARDVRCLATRAREALIYKEIASWAARNAFPKWQEGRHPHCHFRGLLRLHSHYGPPDRSAAQRRPLSRGSNPCGCPQAARQLPDQSTTLRVDSSSTDDSRVWGALTLAD